MAHDHDSQASGEQTTQGDPDLALTLTVVSGAAPRELADLSTETATQAPGPIPGPTPPGRLLLQAGSALKHYEIVRELGEGGMGTVFLARDTRLGRMVAIKVLLKHTDQRAARFLAEARVTARCKHENIVVIHDVDELHSCPFMVLEYLEGRTLRDWMIQRKPPGAPESPAAKDSPSELLSPSLAVELMLPVVRALARAHQMGIVHRDL
jgi:serine/threonine protein kinase